MRLYFKSETVLHSAQCNYFLIIAKFWLNYRVAHHDVNFVEIVANVTTAQPNSFVKLGVLLPDANLNPATLLFESAALDASTTGLKSAALNLSFTKGTIILLAFLYTGTAGLVATVQSSLYQFALAGTNSAITNYPNVLTRSGQTNITTGVASQTVLTVPEVRLKTA